MAKQWIFDFFAFLLFHRSQEASWRTQTEEIGVKLNFLLFSCSQLIFIFFPSVCKILIIFNNTFIILVIKRNEKEKKWVVSQTFRSHTHNMMLLEGWASGSDSNNNKTLVVHKRWKSELRKNGSKIPHNNKSYATVSVWNTKILLILKTILSLTWRRTLSTWCYP